MCTPWATVLGATHEPLTLTLTLTIGTFLLDVYPIDLDSGLR